MALFPMCWQCLKCRFYIYVDAATGHNVRAPDGFAEIWCDICKEWGNPVAPNGHQR